MWLIFWGAAPSLVNYLLIQHLVSCYKHWTTDRPCKKIHVVRCSHHSTDVKKNKCNTFSPSPSPFPPWHYLHVEFPQTLCAPNTGSSWTISSCFHHRQSLSRNTAASYATHRSAITTSSPGTDGIVRLVDGCRVGWPIFLSVWRSHDYVIGGYGAVRSGATVGADLIFVFLSPKKTAFQRERVNNETGERI